MLVKVGNKVYDSNKEPVMVVLSDEDKANISTMAPEHNKYCSFPDTGYTDEQIQEFMLIGDE